MTCAYRHNFEVEGNLILCRWCGEVRAIEQLAVLPPLPLERGRPPEVERDPPLDPDADPVDELEAEATATNARYQKQLLARLLREGGMAREASDAELLEAEQWNLGQGSRRMVEVDPESEDMAPEGSMGL